MRRLLALCLLVSAAAAAHPMDLGLVEVEADGARLRVTLDLHPDVAGKLLGVTAPSAGTIEARGEELFRATLATGGFEGCEWEKGEAALEEKSVRFRAEARCSGRASELRWRFPFVADPRLGTGFQLVVQRKDGGGTETAEKGRDSGVLPIGRPGFPTYVLMGIEHIGAWPSEWVADGRFKLPDGIDHILFVIALVLGGGTLLQLARTVTGFTLGHSITLALGAFGLVSVPAPLVESLIALSIVVVAMEAVLDRDPAKRWRVAAVFGLVHGLGFASALRDLSLAKAQLLPALAGFNVGVELGQVAIVLAVFPLVHSVRKVPERRRVAIPFCGLPIAIAGGYWFVVRAFGLS